ncbi:hypothetical protein ACFDR9_005486 [Janthinobacterium sp. CG_23.3]|uniref:PoNe immunity protein domain-containing protein n=1 Tax=Janthinobacterium sp. CG_23.3 TaxID=3349634 RepID=UPI0038D36D6F
MTYSERYIKYDNSAESEGAYVALLPLLGDGYEQANRLVCFTILLGHEKHLKKLMPIIDFKNPKKDGLLERLVSFYVTDRGMPPDECTRHLPYFKTLKIFSAEKEKRAEMMATYLEQWYHASRREAYHDSHERGMNFFGYWSWEAAAITYLLDIDDRSFRDAQFYPKDLVDFARNMQADPTASGTAAPPDGELRATAGQSCPKAGRWEALDIPPQVKSYQQDELMLNLGSAYGLTVWRYMDG